MITAANLARVTRMFVLRCDRLDEADGSKFAVLRRSIRELDELLFVTQVRSPRRTWRKGCVIVQRIVVKLKLPVRTVWIGGVWARVRIRAGRTVAIRPARRADFAVRVRPPARVPRPANAVCAQFVADGHPRLWR